MSYESRIYIVEAGNWGDRKTQYAEIIASFNMCTLGKENGWLELFDTPIDYKIFVDPDCETNEDCYGDIIKSGNIEKIVNWLETTGKNVNNRRIPPLLGMLKGFDKSKWRYLQIVHYGY